MRPAPSPQEEGTPEASAPRPRSSARTGPRRRPGTGSRVGRDHRGAGRTWLALLAAVLLGSAGSAWAGGFSVDGQSAQASGLGGALAAVPDPSSLYVNPGAAAFFQEASLAGGGTARLSNSTTFISGTSVFGTPLSTSQDDSIDALPHVFTITPMRPNVNLGVAAYTPFDLDSTWASPDGFAGRTVSTQARIRTLDVNTSLTFRLSDCLGVAFGVVARTSELEHTRRVQTTDPDTGGAVDFASFGVASDMETGFGWNVGVYHRPLSWLAWGISYRSAIEIDYGGSGVLTQIATGNDQLDDVLAAGNPFDLEVPFSSKIEFPEVARLGVAVGPPEQWMVLLDAEFTGWSSVQAIDIDVPDLAIYSRTFDLEFDDTVSFYLGGQYQTAGGVVG
ncbi:MAG: outer membrane protein transport protein, partial [Holophagales bacterium]|nr:outer membrane protein transport protein [Holophagales bacterium]